MEQDVQVDANTVMRFLLNGLVWAVALGAVAAAAVFYVRRDVAPTYESTTTLYAADSLIDLRSLNLAYVATPPIHVAAYRAAALSNDLIAGALTVLGATEITPGQVAEVRSRLRVSADVESRLVSITASGGSGQQAAALATAVAGQLIAWDLEYPQANVERMIASLQDRIAALAASDQQSDPALGVATELQNLRAQLASLTLGSDSVLGRLEVVQSATVPSEPVAPSPAFEAAIAALVAFILAYLALLVWRIAGPGVRDLRQISALSGLPVLAAYGAVSNRTGQQPSTSTSFLRSALMPPEGVAQVILVTSVGKPGAISPMVSELAESFVLAGFDTLLVGTPETSAELRARYSLRNQVAARSTAGKTGAESAPQAVPVHLGRGAVLGVLLTPPPSFGASEQLSDMFRRNIKSWTSDNQVVIVQTPPIFESATALTLSAYAGEIVLVVDRRTTRRAELVAAVQVLEQHGAPVAGLVVTNYSARRMVAGDIHMGRKSAAQLTDTVTRST